jgi:hypothetical protein
MVHGTIKTKYEKNNSKRISPNKDRTKKKAIYHDEKNEKLNGDPLETKLSAVPHQLLFEDDEPLLTPEFILKSYATKKNPAESVTFHKKNNGAQEMNNMAKEFSEEENKTNGTVSILELLSKKDNLEKLVNSVSKAVDQSKVIEMPVKPNMKTPSSSPSKKSTIASERFAGLSNSPAPSTLPLPSFSFLDQELNNGNWKDGIPQFSTYPAVHQLQSFPAAIPNSNPTFPVGRFNPPSTPQPARVQSVSLTPKSATPQPPKLKSGKHRKPSPPIRHPRPSENSLVSESVVIPAQAPVRTMNHSPPSNPHLDELSSQLRMMLNIGSVQS